MVLVASAVNGVAVRQDLFKGWSLLIGWAVTGSASIGGATVFFTTAASSGGVESPISLTGGKLYEIKVAWSTSPGGDNIAVNVGATSVTDSATTGTGTFWVTPAATAVLSFTNYTVAEAHTTSITQLEVRELDLETGADTGTSTGTSTADTTYIDTQYPATGTGKVEEIEVNLAVNGNSIKVGCGQLVGTTFKPRNVVTIDTTGDGIGIKTYTAANSDFAKFGIMRGDFLMAYSSSVTQLALIAPTPKGLGSVSGDQTGAASFTAAISTASSVQMQARGFRLEAGKINGQNLSDIRQVNGAITAALGCQCIPDPEMENAGVGDWSPVGCTITKETTDPYTGTQSLRATKTGSFVRIYPYDGSAFITLAAGTYLIEFALRTEDGDSAWLEYFDGSTGIIGAQVTSTDWTFQSVLFTTAVNGTNINTRSGEPTIGDWYELGLLSVRELV